VRDEGDKNTLTLKIIDGEKIEDQKEISLVIDSLEEASELLSVMGCRKKAYQESKRELWLLDGVEVTIDEWPYLDPYVEIEGVSEQLVKDASVKLGFDYSQALFCSVDKLYEMKYGVVREIICQNTERITFSDPNPFIDL
jgi:adenylate cyclase class 2